MFRILMKIERNWIQEMHNKHVVCCVLIKVKVLFIKKKTKKNLCYKTIYNSLENDIILGINVFKNKNDN